MALKELRSAPMALKDNYRTIAFGITLCVHLVLISPFAGWLDRNLLPALQDEGIEIELIQPESDKEEKVPAVVEKVEPPHFEEPPVDYIFKNLPTEKKKLSQEIVDDKVIDPFDEKPPQPDKKKVDPEKTDWDLVDKILNEPLEKTAKKIPSQEEKVQKRAEKAVQKDKNITKQDQGDPDVLKGEKLLKQSPLFLKPGETLEENNTPGEIQKTFKDNRPERTNWDKLEFSMNTYKWSYKRYIENWAIDINKWWVAPVEYLAGNIPAGGGVWIRIRLSKTGHLLGYKVFKSNLTSEMELNVIQALIGSLERPALPKEFPEDVLIINWKFIYPPIMPRVQIRKN